MLLAEARTVYGEARDTLLDAMDQLRGLVPKAPPLKACTPPLDGEPLWSGRPSLAGYFSNPAKPAGGCVRCANMRHRALRGAGASDSPTAKPFPP